MPSPRSLDRREALHANDLHRFSKPASYTRQEFGACTITAYGKGVHSDRARRLGVVSSVMVGWCCAAFCSAKGPESSAVEHASIHILVKFKPDVRRNASRFDARPEGMRSNLLARLKLPLGAALEEPALT